MNKSKWFLMLNITFGIMALVCFVFNFLGYNKLFLPIAFGFFILEVIFGFLAIKYKNR